jgi:glyoxylase-like metal-dependent hydrolase (beta-lactamase superfamily II)
MSTRVHALVPVTFALVLSGAWLTGAEQELDVSVEPVGGKVSMLSADGAGNLGVQVGEDGILVIDDQFLDRADALLEAIGTLAEGDPTFLINTHWHGDHTGGNARFGRTATILAHTNVRRRLVGDATTGGRTSQEAQPAVALPVVTYEDGVSVHFNGEEVRLIHVPAAHTDGDTVVWFTGSNVIHLGDLYFEIGFPFVDVQSGGDVEGMIAGLRGLMDRVPADVRVIPGHGVVTGLDGLESYVTMLETITGRVRELQAEGFSVDEMLEAGVAEEFAERWTWGFIDARRFVGSVVASLDD